jgi:hypothetical protein
MICRDAIVGSIAQAFRAFCIVELCSAARALSQRRPERFALRGIKEKSMAFAPDNGKLARHVAYGV